MKATLTIRERRITVDLSIPFDISMPLKAGVDAVSAFYIPPVKIEPVRLGTFIGSIEEGASCNVNNILFNPHGNGTHTECVGHISTDKIYINDILKTFFFLAKVITVQPKDMDNGDKVITKDLLEKALGNEVTEAIVIRTMPNEEMKVHQHYSGTNPAYLHHEAASYLRENGVKHLLLDLPSVDREDDEGKLLAHKAFWDYSNGTGSKSTITELVFLSEKVTDGLYLLNLQICSLENDASPSKPVLYKVYTE